MNALNFPSFERATPLPVVLLIDPQRWVDDHSPAATQAAQAIENCRIALAFARRHGFPIAMTRWRVSGARFRGWVRGLEPHASEMVFDQLRASCYSSETFADMMSSGGGGLNTVIACPINPVAWISTAGDASRRGHRITLLSDASAAHALESSPAGDEVQVATRIAEQCQLTTVRAWMSSQLAAFRGESGG
jgi:nicotinamidase-related amidase